MNHKNNISTEIVGTLLKAFPENLSRGGTKEIFEFATDDLQMLEALSRLPNRWHHLYFRELAFQKEQFLRVSFRGKFTETGLFRWYFREKDTPESRIEELREKLKKIKECYEGTELKIKVHFNRGKLSTIPHNAKFRGRFYIFNTYYLPNFLSGPVDVPYAADLVDYYHLHDSNFANEQFLDAGEYEDSIISDGDRFSIFRKRLHKDDFTKIPTNLYKVKWLSKKTYRYIDTKRKNKGQDKVRWYVRLSKTGIVEVREERDFDLSLQDLLTTLLDYRPPIETSGNEITGIEIAKSFAGRIVDVAKTVANTPSNYKAATKPRATNLERISKLQWCGQEIYDNCHVDRERQRYITIKLDDIYDINSKASYSPRDFVQSNRDIIEAMLDGSFQYEEGSCTSLVLPASAGQTPFNNLATWNAELCIFGSERCLIFSKPKTTLHSGRRADNDEDYWRCIIRGIEHTNSVKTAVHLNENWTIKMTSNIPRLVQLFDDYEKAVESKNAKRETTMEVRNEAVGALRKFTQEIALILRYLPAVREISVASSAFRASFAVDKFEYLNERVFHLPEILRHIQQNIDEISGFMQFLKQYQMTVITEQREEKAGRMVVYLAVLSFSVAVLVSFFSWPSFVPAITEKCGTEFWEIINCYKRPEFRGGSLVFLTILCLLHFIVCLFYEFFRVADQKRPFQPPTWWTWLSFLIPTLLWIDLFSRGVWLVSFMKWVRSFVPMMTF